MPRFRKGYAECGQIDRGIVLIRNFFLWLRINTSLIYRPFIYLSSLRLYLKSTLYKFSYICITFSCNALCNVHFLATLQRPFVVANDAYRNICTDAAVASSTVAGGLVLSRQNPSNDWFRSVSSTQDAGHLADDCVFTAAIYRSNTVCCKMRRM